MASPPQAPLPLHQLESVVLDGIVAAGHLHSPVQVEVVHGEVELGGGHHAQADHVDTEGDDALDEMGDQGGRGFPHVHPHRHPASSPLHDPGGIGASEVSHRVGIEVAFHHASDVVLAEDVRVH